MELSDGIKRHIADKRVVPSIPPGRAVLLESEDAPARSDRRDGTAGLGLFIEYVDAGGAPSARRITCRSYDASVDSITAWCHEREALREFRVERITSAACTETGELFDLSELVAVLRQRNLPLRSAGLNVSLRLLTFLMRCDGVHRAELEVLENAVTSYALRFGGDDALVEQGVRVARTLAPDGWDFLRALRWMRLRTDGPALARFVRGHGQLLVDADLVQTSPEARFGIELDSWLRALAARG